MIIISWIFLLGLIVLFGWLGGRIAKQVGIPRWLGVIIGIGIFVAIVFLTPIGELAFFFLTGCCQ